MPAFRLASQEMKDSFGEAVTAFDHRVMSALHWNRAFAMRFS
jgi:hypothetical protein